MTTKINRNKLIDLEYSANDIKSEISDLVVEKKSLEFSMSQLRNKLNNRRLTQSELDKINKRREKLRTDILNLDSKILDLKKDLRHKSVLQHDVKINIDKVGRDEIIDGIESMKRKYSEFSQDLTRVSSMRVIASQVVDELDKILQLAINKNL